MNVLFASDFHFADGAVPWPLFFLVFLVALVCILLREHGKLWLSGGLFLTFSAAVMAMVEHPLLAFAAFAVFAVLISALFRHASGRTLLAITAALGAAVVASAVISTEGAHAYGASFTKLKTIAGFSFIAAMFYVYEYCGHSFLASGVAEHLAHARFLRKNFSRRLAWLTFCASAFVDNVAAGKMAKKIAQKRYGKKTLPTDTTVAIICASNAGGAFSPIGDTTTIMIVTSVLILIGKVYLVFLALPACIAYQCVINAFLPKEEAEPETEIRAHEHHPIHWSRLLPLLGIAGLVAAIIVSLFLPESDFRDFLPLIGLTGGFALGCGLGSALTKTGWGSFHMEWHVLASKSLLVNTAFIVFLLGSAHMLPIFDLVGSIERNAPWLLPNGFMYLLGYLSAYFDNIPLTEAAILMGGLIWHRLAFLVGVGGSMTWSGSSCGVNVTIPEKEESSQATKESHPDEPGLYEPGDTGTEAREEQDPARDISVWFGRKGYWHYKGWLAMTVGFLVDLVLFWALGMTF